MTTELKPHAAISNQMLLPEVVAKWTAHFLQIAVEKNCFGRIKNIIVEKDLTTALLIAGSWFQFSDFMPWFLTCAASKMRDNERRHYVVRVAYEELGERNVGEIHSELFIQAGETIGLSICREMGAERLAISFLADSMIASNSDSLVLGISLGLEIVAYENIDTIFSALAYEQILERQLRDTTFFKTHFVNEEEHIRLTVSNFLRFCDSDNEKNEFMIGFGIGLEFWKKFWDAVANECDSRLAKNAV